MRHSPHIAVSAIIVAVTLMLSSCKFGHEESLDFTDLKTAKGLTFKVLSQHETDLCEKLPAACYLPDGSLLEDYTGTIGVVPDGMRKTSSTTTANILQQLLKFGNKKKVYEIVGTYPSIDENGKHVVLSGKVMLPKGQKPKRMIIVSHYTLGSNAEAPSNSFSLEGILTKLGYGIILPDYLGYGVTADRTHPYLVMQITAQNVLDMYFAVKPWLKAVGMEPEHNDVYLMGYSQGGATTMAVQYMAEMYYTEDEIDIHRVFVGGGPYDIKATYERFVNSDTAGYPVAVPLVIQGMILGNHLDLEMVDIIQPWLYKDMDDWINSKKYTTAQINSMIGTTVTHEILTKEGMNPTSVKVAELYKAMTENSIANQAWLPHASVYMMHSMDDETVPYTNATNAKQSWGSANITYNFGHYGSHVKTCLRFIFTVRNLIEEEEKETEKYK